jgi:tripartite-type tricarboxylate transporter receptor subunit TctC
MRNIFAVAVALMVSAGAQAQDSWPQHAVTMVVPFGAGGSADLTARILATYLQTRLGSSFVIENKGGAGGSIGAGFVARAPNDGYTLLVGTVSSNAVNAALYTRLPYDLERDFQPVSRLVLFPNLLFVNPKIPARSVAELITYLKANPGKVNYGSSGIGTSSHLSSVMFALATGTEMTHIPFRSTSEVINNMIGGHIDLGIDSMTTTIPHARSGAVRALAVTTPQRSPSMPDLPTIAETLPGYEATAWQGLFAPAGTPRPVVDQLAVEVKRILETPEVASSLEAVGAEPAPMPPDAFAAFTRTERAKWKEIVRVAGVRVD